MSYIAIFEIIKSNIADNETPTRDMIKRVKH